MLEVFFKDSLKLAGQLRPRYPQSLGSKTDRWEEMMKNFVSNIPAIYSAIYNNVSGTKREIKEQNLMDYTPGYRLINITELAEEKKNLESILNDKYNKNLIIPLLVNYSNDYICYYRFSTKKECICALMHDDGELIVMYESPEKFLETICEFYKQEIYFLDSEGYLDYDMDKEALIGSKINPGIGYWL